MRGAAGLRSGGPAPCYLDPARRAALMALFDDGFPGLPAGIDAAARVGADWASLTEPFVAWEGEQAVGHVGVLAHPVRLDGRDVVVAGVHAVVTRSDRRGRGVARGLLDEALGWVDARFDVAKLATDFPAVYSPHGFRSLVPHSFGVAQAGGEGRARALRDDEVGWFRQLLATRAPVSDRFASRDPGWLVEINLALQGRGPRDLLALDALGAVIDCTVRDGTLHLHDLFAPALPPLADVLALAPAHERVELHLCPDLLAPQATPIPRPELGVWMVRGAWPLPDDAPIAMGRLAGH